MTIKPSPNAVAVNFLDTAVLNPQDCLDLMNRFDMAACTVFDGTNTKEALATGALIRQKRPQSVVFFRRWRDNLHDERLPFQTRPDEWVKYMKDALDMGLTPAAYNESLVSPMTPITNYSAGILQLIGDNPNYSSVHFKVPFGNPGGYNGEHLLPPTDPRYRPDGYAESDNLWLLSEAINKPRIDRGDFPGVWLAPHSYYPTTGSAGGMSDRHREIYRRADFLKLARKYLPLAAGESGIVKTDPLDANQGWDGLIDGAAYADIHALVMFKDYLPYNLIAHLFAYGRGAAGQYAKFDLMRVNTFWDRLELILKSGAYRLPYWYGSDYLNAATLPVRPTNLGDGVKIIINSTSFLNLRSKGDIDGADIGDVKGGESAVIFPATRTPQITYTWYYVTRLSPTPGESREGWINYPGQLIPSPPVVIPIPNAPYPPPEPVPIPNAPYPPPAPIPVSNPPAPTKGLEDLTIHFTFSYEGISAAQREKLKQAYAALHDYLDALADVTGTNSPEITVEES